MSRIRRSPVIIPEEDSATIDLIDYMGVEPLNRETFIKTNWMGDYDPNTFPAKLEEELPVQFRRATLLETQLASENIQ